MAACPMLITRTHAVVSTVAAAEQQPEGWRFVPDTILPGYQWAPQLVAARTPTVHWGPISGKAVGGPNTVQHSSTVQKQGRHVFLFSFFFSFFPFFLFFLSSFLPFFLSSFFPFFLFGTSVGAKRGKGICRKKLKQSFCVVSQLILER